MSAMVEMSRAIRETLERYGSPTLREIDDEALEQFVQITGAFYLDLKEELERRREGRE